MMEISVQYILLTVLYGKCLLGLTVNLIIVAANFMKWKSLKCLQTCDKILSFLAISRGLFFLCVIIRNSIFLFFPRTLQNTIVLSILYIQIMFVFFSTHWIAAILCVFYCVKIVTYNYKLFIFLKTRISTMVPWLIQASLLISLISSFLFGWYGYNPKPENVLNGSTENLTEYEYGVAQSFNNRLLIFATGNFLPFVIFLFSNSLLIHFLLIHTRRMRSDGSQIQGQNLRSHFGALKSMSFFLLLQIIFFICACLFTGGIFHNHFSILLRWIILCSPLLFHSLYMISSSREMTKILISKCHSLIRCL